MAASRIIVSENIEIPVVDGKVQCIRCRNWKLPGEMHSNDRTCQECYEDIRARNKNKPKPKNDSGKIIKRNGMGWIERNEKPTRAVGDSQLAKMIILERAADNSISLEPLACDEFGVSETINHPTGAENEEPDSIDGFRVSEIECKPSGSASGLKEEMSACIDGFRASETASQSLNTHNEKPDSEDGIIVSGTKDNCADNDYPGPIAPNGIRVTETKDNCADNDYPGPIASNGIRVTETKDNCADNDYPGPIAPNGIRVTETKDNCGDNDYPRPIAKNGIRVTETKDNCADNDYPGPIAPNGIRVTETKDNCGDNDYPRTIAANGIRVTETKSNCGDNDYPRTIAANGIRVSDTDPQSTDDVQKDTLATIPITEDGIRVSDTSSNIVSDTESQSIICDPKTKANDGIRVSDTRLIELERALGIANETLANALRRIRALEEKLEKLSPVIEKEEAKRDSAGLQKLRDDLFKLLRERMEKSHTNGIYVHSLYGKNGRRGGKLNISKMQAFRLRDACRGDDRFRVEKTENQQGNWAILLNIRMN